MVIDPGEKVNLYKEHPEIVDVLLKQLKYDINTGSTVDNSTLKNDINNINLWKNGDK